MIVKFKDQETLISEGYYNEDNNSNTGDWWESEDDYKIWVYSSFNKEKEPSAKYLSYIHAGEMIDTKDTIYENLKNYEWAIEKIYPESKYPELYI